MLKDTALRKKMAELGLSTSGSRQMLERRHQEWITIWNANCDSVRPKRRSELMHDLEVWERTMGTRAPTMSRAANIGAQIKDKDFDGAAWATKHDSSFKDLIAMARNSRSKTSQEVTEDSQHDEGSREVDSAQEEGKRREDPGPHSTPGRSEAVVIDLTGPTINRRQGPDSPSKSGRGFIQASNASILGHAESVLVKEATCVPQTDAVPNYSPPRQPEGASL
jgi:E3 ubiquitin-protein ligase RAD18